jgi:CRP-like cAMP-binding protein
MDAISGAHLLEKCVLFRALDEEGRRELASHARPRSYKSGDAIFHIGGPGQSMMLVLVGSVRISLPARAGKEVVLADLSNGEVFGEIALLDGRERSAAATAITNCELLVLERRDVLPYLERRPDICLRLLELLCARLRRSDERMADIAFLDLGGRLAKTLLRETEQQGAGHPPKLSLSQGDLADMIGSTRESVNRQLREWQRHGILDMRKGWIVLLRRDALESIVE